MGAPVRAVNAACRVSISWPVRWSWSVSSGRKDASVANLSQVKQAFPLPQTCRGGSRQYPLGSIRSVR